MFVAAKQNICFIDLYDAHKEAKTVYDPVSDINQLIKRKRLKQYQVAEAAGVGRAHLNQILGGHSDPKVSTLRAVYDGIAALTKDDQPVNPKVKAGEGFGR
jgi:predicted transcriptional regulator